MTVPIKNEPAESFAERINRLFRELDQAIKWNRPSILIAVHTSEFVRADAEAALGAKLRELGQTVTPYRVTGEDNADIPLHLSQHPDKAKTVFFISGLQWGGGKDGRNAYRALNIRREYFVDYLIRAVFWLTEKEAIALPNYAPDFWAFRHRVVEFVEAPEPEQVVSVAREFLWRSMDANTLYDDTDAKIALREALLADLPNEDTAVAVRADLLFTLSGLYWAKREYEKSIKLCQQALAFAEFLKDIRLQSMCHNGLGVINSDLNRINDAISAYRRAMELESKDATPHSNLGNLYLDLGRFDDAIAEFQCAIELNPKWAIPHNNLGSVYHQLGRYDDAIAEYKHAIDLDSMMARPHNNLGNLYRDLGHPNDAIIEYQRAIELDPKWATPHNNLAYLNHKLGRYTEAITEYQRAIELNPKSVKVRVSLAACYRKLGREAEYAEQIKIARELIAQEDEYNRASFESVCGNVDEALKLLKVALEKKQQSLAWARRDPDFDFIRDDPRFKALVGE